MGQQIHWMLTVKDESKPSFSVMLACGDKVVVGRSRTCEVILSDPSLSRKHCFFGVNEDGILKLVDLGALHPTLLNGVVVKEGCGIPVPDGSQIRLGRGSFIKVECLGEKLSSRGADEGPEVEDDLEHTPHTKVLEKSNPPEHVEESSVEKTVHNDDSHGPKNKNSNDIAEGKLQTDALQPLSRKKEDERKVPSEKLDERSPVNAPQNPTEKLVGLSDQQDETSLVNLGESTRKFPADKRETLKKSEDNVVPQEGTLVDDDQGDVNRDEATKLIPVHTPKKSGLNQNKKPAPRRAVNQDHAEVLGKTLQGKLVQTKQRKPEPVLNNADRNEIDIPALDETEAEKTTPSGGAEQNETNFVDPAELQKPMKGKAGKGGRKSAGPRRPSRHEGDDEKTTPSGAGEQDETNFVDPAELQKPMKGKAGRGGRKSAVPKQSSRNEEDDEKTTPSGNGEQDETNFIDPAELQKLMKGKAGKGGRKNSAPRRSFQNEEKAEKTTLSSDGEQDETNFIDPAELQKLMKGKKVKDGPRGTVPQRPARHEAEADNTASFGDDDQDETNFIDPAELQKLMKGKAGKGGRKSVVPKRSPRNEEAAEKTTPSGGDEQDETNFIDPAELRKLMKGKAGPSGKKSAASKGSSRKGNEVEQSGADAGDEQDETNFIDPAELRKLMKKGKAGPFGKKGAAPKGSSQKGNEAGQSGADAGDEQDETNFIDPAELRKLMKKGKAGPFGKKSAAPKGSSRKGDEAEPSGADDGDERDETNYIDPAELQKLMKGKANPPKSKKRWFR